MIEWVDCELGELKRDTINNSVLHLCLHSQFSPIFVNVHVFFSSGWKTAPTPGKGPVRGRR